MTAAWDRDEALRAAARLDEVSIAGPQPSAKWREDHGALDDAAALLRAADAEITRLRSREDAAAQMAEALREIATSDDMDMLLDPTRASRIAKHFLAAWDASHCAGAIQSCDP